MAKHFCRMFPYFGAKHRHIGKYPKPKYAGIVEPFAGSAAYATRYNWLSCILCDVDPVVCGVWDYLIKTPGVEIRSLPCNVQDIRELPDSIPQEAKWLIGFWLQPGASKPATRMSSRAMLRPDTAWSARTRDRTGHQADYIKHWKIYNTSYENITGGPCTWFVDPPYEEAGKHYVCNSVDYTDLAGWCLSRQGQVIVCEQAPANWLPFTYLGEFHSSLTTFNGRQSGRMSTEVIYERDTAHESRHERLATG